MSDCVTRPQEDLETVKKKIINVDACRQWVKNSTTDLANFTDEDIDDILKESLKELPSTFLVEFFDIAILYSQEDREEVENFETDIKKKVLLADAPNTPIIYTVERSTGGIGAAPVLKILGEVLKRSVYLFIFLTENLCNDGFSEIATHEALKRTLSNRETMWSIVPCFMGPENCFELPFGISCLRGLRVDKRDRFTYENMKSLLTERRGLLHKRRRENRNRAAEWYKQKVIDGIRRWRFQREKEAKKIAEALTAPLPTNLEEPAPQVYPKLPPSATTVEAKASEVQVHHHIHLPNVRQIPETMITLRGQNFQIGENNEHFRVEYEPGDDQGKPRYVLVEPDSSRQQDVTESIARGQAEQERHQHEFGQPHSESNYAAQLRQLQPDNPFDQQRTESSDCYIHSPEKSEVSSGRMGDFSDTARTPQQHSINTPPPPFPDIGGIEIDSLDKDPLLVSQVLSRRSPSGDDLDAGAKGENNPLIPLPVQLNSNFES